MSKTLRILLAMVAGLALIAAACGDDDGGSGSSDVPDGPDIVIGAQQFGESAILGEIYKQGLAAKGYTTSIQDLGGFRDVEVAAFDSGDINFAPEYAASMLEFLNDKAGEATSDAGETTDKLQTYLDDKDITAFDPSDAVDTNAFVITQATSDDLGIKSLSDLADKGADLKLGGPADCETNPFCIPGLKDVYGLDLSDNFTSLEPGAVADALESGDIDIALLFSTDGRIADKGWVLLDDDKKMLAADNVVPVAKNDVTDAYGDDLASAVNDISAKLTTDALIDMNKSYDIDKEDPAAIAKTWLEDNDLL